MSGSREAGSRISGSREAGLPVWGSRTPGAHTSRRASASALLAALAALGSLGCASPQRLPALDAPVLEPRPDEVVALDQLVLVLDASSSVSEESLFQDEKAWARAFARSIPDGDYETSVIAFGGFRREVLAPAPFERARLVVQTSRLSHLAEGSPIHRALLEAGRQLAGRRGRAAIVLASDGALTSEGGHALDPQLALAAAEAVRAGHDGRVCFHTVQLGSDPAGAALLRRIAGVSDCGSFRPSGALATVAALHDLERDVFLTAAPPPVAAAPRDSDGDGVPDAVDPCPGTPRGARVDARGCWVLSGLLFDSDSARIRDEGRRELAEVAAVLRANQHLRVRLDGHTDATGSDAYNLALSRRRAEAVRRALQEVGVDASRLQTRGHGEASPAADNATPEGRRTNRRTELTVLP